MFQIEELEEVFEVSASKVIPKLIGIFVFFAGAIAFGVRIGKMEFAQDWKKWTALILGEFAYLYSFVFVVVAIVMTIVGRKETEEYGIGARGVVMILCLAAMIQLVFWGIVCANYELLKIAGGLLVIIIAIAVWFKLTSK